MVTDPRVEEVASPPRARSTQAPRRHPVPTGRSVSSDKAGVGLPSWRCWAGPVALDKTFSWGFRCAPHPAVTELPTRQAGAPMRQPRPHPGPRDTWATMNRTLGTRRPRHPSLTPCSLDPVPRHSVLTMALQELSPPFHRPGGDWAACLGRAEAAQVWGKHRCRWPGSGRLGTHPTSALSLSRPPFLHLQVGAHLYLHGQCQGTQGAVAWPQTQGS